MSGTSIVQFLGTKGRSIINKIRSPKESKIAARTKSLHDAIAYHENKAIEHLRIFNESIPKLRITLNSENPNIKYIIKNYSFTIPIAQLFLKMNYPDHLLFQDYIDGNYLLAGLDIYKGILNFKNDRLTATGQDKTSISSTVPTSYVYADNKYSRESQEFPGEMQIINNLYPLLEERLTQLKAKLLSQPILTKAEKHYFSIILSLGRHGTKQEADYFKGLIKKYRSDLIIIENNSAPHSNLYNRVLSLEESIRYFPMGKESFFNEIGKLIRRSEELGLVFRDVEGLPVTDRIECANLFPGKNLKNKIESVENALRQEFEAHRNVHRGSVIREKNIIGNLKHIIENFDFYFPKYSDKKKIVILMRYGGFHYALDREIIKNIPDNLNLLTIPDPSQVGHLKIMNEFDFREDIPYETGFNADIAQRMFLNDKFVNAPLEGVSDELFRSMLHYTFVKRANFKRVFDAFKMNLSRGHIVRDELRFIERHYSLEKALKEDHPEYSDIINRFRNIL